MNYIPKISTTMNGQDVFTEPLSIDYVHRIISLSGEINDNVSTIVNSSIRHLARLSSDDIILYINSPGGSVTSGFSILDTVKAINCDVRTVATGIAASMGAFLLATAGTKGKRYATPNSQIMIHQPLGGAYGQASDIRIHAENIIYIKEKINRLLADCTGQPLDIIDKDSDRDNFMSAEDALKYGLIDKIGDPFSEEV